MELELVDLVSQGDSAGVWVEEEAFGDFVWVCPHGSIMGDCFLAGSSEFPGVGLTTWEVRTEMAGITLNLN